MRWIWAWALVCVVLASCGGELTQVPGTTTRVGKPEVAQGTELELRMFTSVADCVGVGIPREEHHLCLPHVDRAAGEVRLGYQFRLKGETYALPDHKQQLAVIHQGTLVQDGKNGQATTVVPHDPNEVKQLFVVLIDGSSSMSERNRMKKVRQALQLPEVQDSFFPDDVKTGVVLLQFTSGEPRPVGGKLRILRNKKEFLESVKQLRVLSGFTHLYDAITYATGALLEKEIIDKAISIEGMAVTVVALTDGFNNVRANDTCRDNAERLSRLLKHIESVREADGADLRRRPTIFTVGLGRPLRPVYKKPETLSTEVKPRELCGRKFANRRIDGDLETRGIDNASLSLIAEKGGGYSYVKRDKKGLGEAFRGAAARRYQWFEVRYRMDPFYLRRSFTTALRLNSFATAEAKLEIHPSAWLDAPPGIPGDDGWVESQSYLHTAVVIMPVLGLLVGFAYMGAAVFNTRRALFNRSRRKSPPPARAAPPAPPGPPGPPAAQV